MTRTVLTSGMSCKERLLSLFVGLGALFLLAACGGGAAGRSTGSQSPAAAHAAAAPEVQALTFSVAQPIVGDASTIQVRGKLETALLAAGFKLAALPTSTHDVDVYVTTQTEFEPSAFQVSFNGQPSGKNHVQVRVSLFSQGTLVDQADADYRAADGTVDDEAIASLVDAVSHSSRLATFAQDLTHKRAADADAQKRAEGARQQAAADAQKRADDA
ncbi:MAG TPA: hypothetical protein VF316_06285, partial [Polyangiaceae bacterium]